MNAIRNFVRGRSNSNSGSTSTTSDPVPLSGTPPSPSPSPSPLRASKELPRAGSTPSSPQPQQQQQQVDSTSALKASTDSVRSAAAEDEAPAAIELKDGDQQLFQQEDRKKLFSKLTGLIGKDIVSLLSLPVSLFEPSSVLQTMAEPLRNSELLFKINSLDDPIDRICMAAAFCVSLFCYYVRTLKPFNPVLGETYEYVPPSKAYKCLCEQLSHHPPIGIAHTTCPEWTLQQISHIETRFWGTSVDLSSIGDNHLIMHKRGDHFTWKNPNVCIHNILFGKIYVEHYGTIPIKNVNTGDSVSVNFKKAGWFGGGVNYELTGEVRDKDGNLRAILGGKRNEYITVTKIDEHGNKGAPVELWRRSTTENLQAHKWKWDPFVETLTELSEELQNILPTTDSRLRGDLRALTLHNVKLAGKEKVAIEERERRKRRERESQGKKWAPVYFKKVQDERFEYRWDYVGNYWEERSQRLQAYKDKKEKKNEVTKDGAEEADVAVSTAPPPASSVDEVASRLDEVASRLDEVVLAASPSTTCAGANPAPVLVTL